jgi:hypothetical protein
VNRRWCEAGRWRGAASTRRHHRRAAPGGAHGLYDELLGGRVPLGEAIRRAKARAVAEDPRSAPVVEGWNLLGDPSIGVLADPAPRSAAGGR